MAIDRAGGSGDGRENDAMFGEFDEGRLGEIKLSVNGFDN